MKNRIVVLRGFIILECDRQGLKKELGYKKLIIDNERK